MLTTRVFTMIALVGALATAAPGILSEAKTNCTAHCTTKDKANGFLLVEQVVVWDMHLLVCEWSKDGTTQGGNYYLDGGVRDLCRTTA
jgi:hypothetical protein